MKNKLYITTALLTALFAAGCSEQENFAGGDSDLPVATVYIKSDAKAYQVAMRVVPNTKVSTMYLYTDTSYDRADFIAEKGEAAYLEMIREFGKKFEGGKDAEYLCNPDNNGGGATADPTDNLMGYITTTVLAQDAQGNYTVQTFDKSCFNTALTLSNFNQNKLGDWKAVGMISVTETSLNKEGQTGGTLLLNIPNTDQYMVPFVWFCAWSDLLGEGWGDFDFQKSGSLIVRIDPKTGDPKGVVSATVSSGYDDQKNGVIGISYTSSPLCSFVRAADGTYIVTGFKTYGEGVAMENNAPVTTTISWKAAN